MSEPSPACACGRQLVRTKENSKWRLVENLQAAGQKLRPGREVFRAHGFAREGTVPQRGWSRKSMMRHRPLQLWRREGGVNVPWSAVEAEEGRKKVLGWQVLLVSIRLREPHMSPDRACVRPFHCSPTLATDVSTHRTHNTTHNNIGEYVLSFIRRLQPGPQLSAHWRGQQWPTPLCVVPATLADSTSRRLVLFVAVGEEACFVPE
jgi:hypothetical protein